MMHVDEKGGTRVLVCTVGKTVLLYDARCVDDLHAMPMEALGLCELEHNARSNRMRAK